MNSSVRRVMLSYLVSLDGGLLLLLLLPQGVILLLKLLQLLLADLVGNTRVKGRVETLSTGVNLIVTE